MFVVFPQRTIVLVVHCNCCFWVLFVIATSTAKLVSAIRDLLIFDNLCSSYTFRKALVDMLRSMRAKSAIAGIPERSDYSIGSIS